MNNIIIFIKVIYEDYDMALFINPFYYQSSFSLSFFFFERHSFLLIDIPCLQKPINHFGIFHLLLAIRFASTIFFQRMVQSVILMG